MAYVLLMILQIAGFPAYLLANAAGQRRYPKGTNRTWPSILDMACTILIYRHRFQPLIDHLPP